MELYWMIILTHLHETFQVFAIVLQILGLLAIILFILGCLADIECSWAKPYKWMFAYLMLLSFVLAIISDVLPSKCDLSIMLGWDAIKSDSVQEVIQILKDKIK